MKVINPSKFGIIGNGGQADEVEDLIQSSQCLFRAVDLEFIDSTATVDVSNPSSIEKEAPIVVAIGAPKLKKILVKKWPGKLFATMISNNALTGSDIRIGEGSIIAQGSVITTNVTIGTHVLVNVSASISHDCVIGDFVTISPGAHIAGRVQIGDGVFVGIGATIINGVKIAPGVVIGAGAVVTSDVLVDNSVVVGVPATTIKINKDWLEYV